MKRKYLEAAILGLILLAIIALAAYPYLRRSGSTVMEKSPTTTIEPSPATAANDRRYSPNLDELRSKFNQDKGKVRLLLLLSPT